MYVLNTNFFWRYEIKMTAVIFKKKIEFINISKYSNIVNPALKDTSI